MLTANGEGTSGRNLAKEGGKKKEVGKNGRHPLRTKWEGGKILSGNPFFKIRKRYKKTDGGRNENEECERKDLP